MGARQPPSRRGWGAARMERVQQEWRRDRARRVGARLRARRRARGAPAHDRSPKRVDSTGDKLLLQPPHHHSRACGVRGDGDPR